MSIHPEFDTPQPAAIGSMPIFLRFQGLHPNDLGRFLMHDARRGGDLSHVNPDGTVLNEVLVGAPNWKANLLAEIEGAKHRNLRQHVKALRAKSRKKDASLVEERDLVDPWRRSRHGPLREGILTVNKEWFGGPGHAEWDPEKVAEFREAAISFLKKNFPDGQLRYASAHADEEAFHIHFVVVKWREWVSANRGRQVLLQSSLNPLFASYEHAQDLVGEAFKELGLTRGERRAEARREAKRNGEPVPPKRRHVPPSEWRAEERRLAAAEAEEEARKIREAAHLEAKKIVDDGRTLAKATVRKSRKRAIKEARERKEEAAREARAATAKEVRRRNAVACETAQLKVAGEAAEKVKHEAEAGLQRIEDKASAIVTRRDADADRLRSIKTEHRLEAERIRALRAEKAKEETARDRAREEVSAVLMKKEEIRAQVQAAEEDLLRVESRVGAEKSKAQEAMAAAGLAEQRAASAELSLEAAKRQQAEEEAKLRAAKGNVRTAKAKAAEIEDTVASVEEAIQLIADRAIRWKDDPAGASKLVWGVSAPQQEEKRKSLISRTRPAMPIIRKIAQMVTNAVQAVLATERAHLASEAAYVAGLRADWDAEQKARLDQLREGLEPD